MGACKKKLCMCGAQKAARMLACVSMRVHAAPLAHLVDLAHVRARQRAHIIKPREVVDLSLRKGLYKNGSGARGAGCFGKIHCWAKLPRSHVRACSRVIPDACTGPKAAAGVHAAYLGPAPPVWGRPSQCLACRGCPGRMQTADTRRESLARRIQTNVIRGNAAATCPVRTLCPVHHSPAVPSAGPPAACRHPLTAL